MNTPDRKEKERLLKLATRLSVLVASTLIVIKCIAWIKTGSVAMLGSLLDSVLDGAAAVLNLMFVRRALRPADQRYRFGHGKAEPVGGMFQSMIIGASAFFLVAESIRRLVEPQMPGNSRLGIVIMLISSALVGLLVLFQRYVVRKTGSMVVSADALHGFGDIMINLGVIVALVISTRFDAPWFDPVVGIVLAGVLIRGAWEIGTKALQHLMDREFSEQDRVKIREIAIAHPQVTDIHDLRTRSAGLSSFIQLHIELDGELNLNEAHEIADDVELSIRKQFPEAEVLIHQDPYGIESISQFLRV